MNQYLFQFNFLFFNFYLFFYQINIFDENAAKIEVIANLKMKKKILRFRGHGNVRRSLYHSTIISFSIALNRKMDLKKI